MSTTPLPQPSDAADRQRAAVLAALVEHPSWAEYLRTIIDWEERNPVKYESHGWDCPDVRTPPAAATSMVYAHIVDRVYHSRSTSAYRLVDLAGTRQALAGVGALPDRLPPITDAEELFSAIVGRDRIKRILRRAVLSERSVGVALVGPPGVAKSVLLDDLERLPGYSKYEGYNITRAGLTAFLMAERPRGLLIDEFDKMAPSDRNALLGLRGTGRIDVLQFGRRDSLVLETKVFVGLNDPARLSEAMGDRFLRVDVPPYSPREFVEVAAGVLHLREGLPENVAGYIATVTARYHLSVRRAIDLARLSGAKTPADVDETAAMLWGDLLPLRGRDGQAGAPHVGPVRRMK